MFVYVFRRQLPFSLLHGQYLFFLLESGYGTPTAAEKKTGLPYEMYNPN
jgi:hypothetical protein